MKYINYTVHFIQITFSYLILLSYPIIAYTQGPLNKIPGVSKIVAYEVTGGFFVHTYAISDTRLYEKLGEKLNNKNDFGGVPGVENYDIYFSDENGNLDINGEHITIECVYTGTTGGGGGNIAHLEIEFLNGETISPNKLSSFLASGSNYISGSEIRAVDCNKNTFTTLGNISGNPTNFLRLTFDFSDVFIRKSYESCIGSGFNFLLGNTVIDENNPSGYNVIMSADGCNKIEIVDIIFMPLQQKNITYSGCPNDGYSITFGGETFDETNPKGDVIVPALVGCDSLFIINLDFNSTFKKEITHTGCKGDLYSITLDGTTYDENNPTGQFLVSGLSSCDTLFNVNLIFKPITIIDIIYNGCQGDMFSITKGGLTFNEQNNKGEIRIASFNVCDTIFRINLEFEKLISKEINFTRCKGDGYSLKVGNQLFNQSFPKGISTITSSNGCDTITYVNLNFIDCKECEPILPNIISLSSLKNNLFKTYLKEECQYQNLELSIYNRWGNLVHLSKNLEWDGTVNGVFCETDVYIYLLKYTVYENIINTITGTITVLK